MSARRSSSHVRTCSNSASRDPRCGRPTAAASARRPRPASAWMASSAARGSPRSAGSALSRTSAARPTSICQAEGRHEPGANPEHQVGVRAERAQREAVEGEPVPRVDGAAGVLADQHRRLEHLGELGQRGRCAGREHAAAYVNERTFRSQQQARGPLDVRIRRQDRGRLRVLPGSCACARRQNVRWQFERHRPRPAAAQLGERAGDQGGNVVRPAHRAGPLGQPGQDPGLIGNLVQRAVPFADQPGVDLPGEQQHT